ncbi:hypothetical protein Pfo_006677 [Paulownia fortunei]|nr:hypothetical protein Pfo_006677 [Paulownia fortunei]
MIANIIKGNLLHLKGQTTRIMDYSDISSYGALKQAEAEGKNYGEGTSLKFLHNIDGIRSARFSHVLFWNLDNQSIQL